MIVATDAIVDPDTMMVLALDAGVAEGAVFAACWFGVVAGGTEIAGVKEEVVVRVCGESRVVGGVD